MSPSARHKRLHMLFLSLHATVKALAWQDFHVNKCLGFFLVSFEPCSSQPCSSCTCSAARRRARRCARRCTRCLFSFAHAARVCHAHPGAHHLSLNCLRVIRWPPVSLSCERFLFVPGESRAIFTLIFTLKFSPNFCHFVSPKFSRKFMIPWDAQIVVKYSLCLYHRIHWPYS